MRHPGKKNYIDEGNCYVWFVYDKTDKVVSASLEIITGVYGQNAFSDETYTVSLKRIDYEDAVWTGVSTEERPNSKTILRRYYYRWEKAIKRLKKDLYDLANQNSLPLQRSIQHGDVILVEYDNPYDLDSWELYDSTDILQILETKGKSNFTVRGIELDRYCFCPFEEPKNYSLEEMECIKTISLLNPALYNRLLCLFKEGATEIYNEIIEKYKR